MRLVIAMVLAVAFPALACEPKGTPIFRIAGGPLDGTPPDFPRGRKPFVIEVFADGAWTRISDGKPDGSGCLAEKPLALLRASIAKAEFRTVRLMTCRALTTTKLVYSAPRRKRSVETGEPCGTPIDEQTARAAACIFAALVTDANSEDILTACRGGE